MKKLGMFLVLVACSMFTFASVGCGGGDDKKDEKKTEKKDDAKKDDKKADDKKEDDKKE